jgi:hypothetical protein
VGRTARGWTPGVSEWDERVAGADVVSFGLDTLLVRALCRPSDVYRLAQEHYNATSGRYLSEELAPWRHEAEWSLRRQADEEGRNPEMVSLADIYARVGALLVLDAGTTAALLAAELTAERRVLRADGRMRERYRRVVATGTPVVVVADTPLPGRFLAGVLEDQGYPAPRGLVVSGDPATRSADDPVWDELLGSSPDRVLVQVGAPASVVPEGPWRTETAPVTGPVEAYSLQVGPASALDGPRVFAHLDIDGFRLKNLHRSLLNAQVAVGLSKDPAPSARVAVGYGALGPFLVATVQWLHRTAVGWGRPNLVFDPDDGRFLADAYRGWWGDDALGVRWSGEPAPGDAPAVEVVSGWNPGTRRWDGGSGPADGTPDRLALAVEPTAAAEEGAGRVDAFVDGRLAGRRSLFDDLFGADRGFLVACLAGGPSSSGAVDDLRRSAVDFVADFGELTSGMPSPVAVVDPGTACENLVMVLNFPQPAAAGVVALESDDRAGGATG